MGLAQVTLLWPIPQSIIPKAHGCPYGTYSPTPSLSLANPAGLPPAPQCDTYLTSFSLVQVFKPAMAFSGIQRVLATMCQAICQ